jgi:hypothetical protein
LTQDVISISPQWRAIRVESTMSELCDIRDNLTKDHARTRAKGFLKPSPGKVDASSYGAPETFDPEKKTGMQPITRRKYRRGGHVTRVEGEHAKHHAGRKPRAKGGKAHDDAAEDRALIRKEVKPIALRRAGKDTGGLTDEMKRGGAAHGPSCRCSKCSGGRTPRATGGAVPKGHYDDEKPNLRHVKTYTGPNGHVAKVYKDRDWGEHRVKFFKPDGTYMSKADAHPTEAEEAHDEARGAVERGFKRGGRTSRATGGPLNVTSSEGHGIPANGGRMLRKSGGRAKGKTDIKIIIGQQPHAPPPMPPHPMMGPPSGPPGGFPPGPPPGGPPPMMGPPGGAPLPPSPMGGPMPRKRGGRTMSAACELAEHTTGSGGGLGRLAKIKAYGHQK